MFLKAIYDVNLDKAVSTDRGNLVPGLIIDGLQSEDWLRLERERLHQIDMEAMSELTRSHLQNNRFDKAQRIPRHQLCLEPWREAAPRQLMQAMAKAGNRTGALIQFLRARELL